MASAGRKIHHASVAMESLAGGSDGDRLSHMAVAELVTLVQ